MPPKPKTPKTGKKSSIAGIEEIPLKLRTIVNVNFKYESKIDISNYYIRICSEWLDCCGTSEVSKIL